VGNSPIREIGSIGRLVRSGPFERASARMAWPSPLRGWRLSGAGQAGAVPVCAVRHERSVVRDVGRIRALGSFVCIPVPKVLPRARMHPEKARPPGPVSGQVRVGLTGPAATALTSALGLVVSCHTRSGPRRGRTLRPYINVAHPRLPGRTKMSDPRVIFEQTSKAAGHPSEFRFE
jgi:hypothetical protein